MMDDTEPVFWSEIQPGLYLSGYYEWPLDYRGDILCVLEQRPDDEPERAMWVPILEGVGANNGAYPRQVRANLGQLDAAADIIHDHVAEGVPLVVHCGGGIERSPLAMAWYLFRKCNLSLDEAYTLIRSKRPIIQDRQAWLPASVRFGYDSD